MLLLVNLSVIQSVHLCPCGLGCGVRPRSHREPPSAGPYRRTCADPHRRLSGPPFALRTCSPSPNSSFGPSAPSPGPFRPCAPASSCIEKRRLPDRSFLNIFIFWPPHVPSTASNRGAVVALFGFWNAFSSGFKADCFLLSFGVLFPGWDALLSSPPVLSVADLGHTPRHGKKRHSHRPQIAHSPGSEAEAQQLF